MLNLEIVLKSADSLYKNYLSSFFI